MSDRIRVAVLGACGKMGREVVKAVAGSDDMEMVGACDVYGAGTNASVATGVAGLSFDIESDFDAMLDRAKPNVVVDFAKPFVMENARKMIRFHPRCGTSFILVVFMISIFIYTFVIIH